jgi:ketosteroid isomerase-like protein
MAGEDALSALEARWNALYLAGDVDGFASLLDDSFRFLSEQGEFEKAAYVSNLASGAIEMRELETVESRTRVFGDVAIVTGRVRMSATFQGRDISGTDRYTRVWRRDGAGWLAISQHANRQGDAT